MKSIPNEVKVAVLVLIALFALYFGFNFLKGQQVFSSENEYTIIYDDVNGLIQGNPVKLSGLKVGMVQEAEILQDGSNRVRVVISVDDDIKVPHSAKAKIVAAGLLGDMEIQLDYGNSTAADFNNLVQHGGDLNGIVEPSMMDALSNEASPIMGKSQELMVSLDSMIAMLNSILEAGQIQNSMASIEKTTATLDQTTSSLNKMVSAEQQNIRTIITDTKQLISGINSSTAQLDVIMANANRFAGNLAETDIAGKSEALMTDVEKVLGETSATFKSLNTTIAKLNDESGSLGMLLNDSKLYDNLNTVSVDLDKLLVDFKENPKKYVQFSLIERKDKSKKKKSKETN